MFSYKFLNKNDNTEVQIHKLPHFPLGGRIGKLGKKKRARMLVYLLIS